MKRIFLFIFSVLLGIGLYFGYKTYLYKPPPVKKKLPLLPSKFSLQQAPANSLRGEMTTLFGDVSIQSRIATEPAKIIVPVPVQQGELIKTGEDGEVVISIKGLTIAMGNASELELIQTIPSALVLAHHEGKVTYTKTGTSPISIRTFHLLTTLDSGTATISADVENARTIVSVADGSVTVGFNDTENVTQSLTITAGERYVFDDQERKGTVKGE